MSRYYVHTAATVPAELQHTAVYTAVSDADTVQQLVAAFLTDYRACHQSQPVQVDDSAAEAITNAAGDRIALTDAITRVLEDRDDVFIAVKPAQPSPPPGAATLPNNAELGAKAAAQQTGKAGSLSTPAVNGGNGVPISVKRELKAEETAALSLLQKATKLQTDGRLRQALKLYEQIVSCATTDSERPSHRIALTVAVCCPCARLLLAAVGHDFHPAA